MHSGDPSGVLQLQIARCASHSSPCTITTPKIECSSVCFSSLSGMYQCRNVTCMNIKVSSLAACFIVTKENEPLLRRLYAAHSSAFPLVSCGCAQDSLSMCWKQHWGQLTVVSCSGHCGTCQLSMAPHEGGQSDACALSAALLLQPHRLSLSPSWTVIKLCLHECIGSSVHLRAQK